MKTLGWMLLRKKHLKKYYSKQICVENRQPIGRTLYIVRHAQREDNINKAWINDSRLNPLGLQWDNSPLSERGRKEQADGLGPMFVFCLLFNNNFSFFDFKFNCRMQNHI